MNTIKVTGCRIVIDVNGFHDAKHWIYRCIRAGIVRCSCCKNPATHVWWNDAAEWFPHCNDHYDPTEQWGGSTRWNPDSFSLNAMLDESRAWRKTLTDEERNCTRLVKYDATDYHALMTKDYWKEDREHYFRGSRDFEGYRCWARLYPLTNGDFCYQLNSGHLTRTGGSSWGYGIRGAWTSEAEAIDAAKTEAKKRGLLPDETGA